MTLAHQLRDLPGFRWAPGMRLVPGSSSERTDVIIVLEEPDEWEGYVLISKESGIIVQEDAWLREHDYVPDLADPATGGILFVSLRDAVAIMRTVDGRYQATLAGSVFYGDTLAEACAALMMARGRCGC